MDANVADMLFLPLSIRALYEAGGSGVDRPPSAYLPRIRPLRRRKAPAGREGREGDESADA
jgi:hypothetical protein